MLGLGWTEMLVIGVVALIFIGPKDLPVVMGRVGKVIGQVQRMGREFQREINKTTGLDEVRNLRTSITSPLKQTAEEIRKDFNAIGKDGKEQPSGALKPTDPAKESVVEAIQQQAGMTPAKKTNDELAASYGFKSSKDAAPKPVEDVVEPAKAVSAPARASASKTSTASKTGTAKAKTATSSKASSAKPAKNAAASEDAPAPAPAPKAARKPAAPKSAAAAEAKPASAAKPAAKPRAPRKKPADAAVKSE